MVGDKRPKTPRATFASHEPKEQHHAANLVDGVELPRIEDRNVVEIVVQDSFAIKAKDPSIKDL